MFFEASEYLYTETARRLFHEVSSLPRIILCGPFSARDLATERHYSNITELWLSNDAARTALRAAGVPEDALTGDTSDLEKFEALAAAVPRLVGHPVSDICHAELRHLFHCDLPINPTTCTEIWQKTASFLSSEEGGLPTLLSHSDAAYIGTRDDPALPLPEALPAGISPTFCANRLLAAESGDADYFEALGNAAGVPIKNLENLTEALSILLDRFTAAGCRAALHILPHGMEFRRPDPYHADRALCTLLQGGRPSTEALAILRTQIWRILSAEYTRRGILLLCGIPQHIPYNGVRNRQSSPAEALYALLQYSEVEGLLPRLLLCPRDPMQFAALAPLCGAFAARRAGEPLVHICAELALRSSAEICSLARTLPLGALILGDTESGTPAARDEYARRVLCDALGTLAAHSAVPADRAALSALARDICYGNAARLLGLA